MESVSNVEKKWRTRQEKDELIALWKQSGKSRKLYCNDQGLNYNSFVSWHQQHKAKAKSETGFSQVIVQSGKKMFTQHDFLRELFFINFNILNRRIHYLNFNDLEKNYHKLVSNWRKRKLNIDNNLVENSIRSISFYRNNYLFADTPTKRHKSQPCFFLLRHLPNQRHSAQRNVKRKLKTCHQPSFTLSVISL